MSPPDNVTPSPDLEQLFELADKIGKKQYHRLTPQDFEDYRKYDHWRYIGGDGECGTTSESKAWVRDNSDRDCPICERRFGGDSYYRTIDHKLPRAQYPWLSLNFANLWVICRACNREKGEMHWFEYEHYMLNKHPDLYPNIQVFRPNKLIKQLRE